MEAINKKGISAVPANGAEKLLPELEEEKLQFKKFKAVLQNSLIKHFRINWPKTVVIIPSLTMDQEILSKIQGITTL
jgi:hypothetical protein